jgi:hypothetical protein
MKQFLTTAAMLWALFSCSFAQFVPLGAQLNGNAPNDNFGWAVSMNQNGKTIAAGAPLYDNDFGQVRAYEEIGGVWTQLGGDIEGIETGNQLGFSVALNANGTRLAVGGIGGNPSTLGGQVQVFQLNGNQWDLMGSPVLAEADGDQFAFSLDMNASGNRFVVGARYNNDNGVKSGQVRVYEWNNTNWIQLGADIDGENAGDTWGTSVSISANGNTIAAGAILNAAGGAGAGHVRAYKWNNNSWSQIGADIDGQTAGESFGLSLSLSNDGQRLVCAAPLHAHGTGFGSVRVYELQSNAWVQLGNDIRGSSTSEGFGEAVAISGDGTRIAAGTKSADDNALSSGRANLYQWDAGQWLELTPPILGQAQFDNLGKSLALNEAGTRVVVGANLAAATQGYAVVYQDSLNPVGIEPVLAGPSVTIFADPVSAMIHFQAEQTLRQVVITVGDLSGKQLYRQIYPQGTHFRLSYQLPAGIYWVRLQHDQGLTGKKLLLFE